MKKFTKLASVSSVIVFIVAFHLMGGIGVQTASANTHDGSASGNTSARQNCEEGNSQSFLGFPTWYKYLDPKYEDGSCTIEAKVDSSGEVDIGATVAAVLFAAIEILLRVAGIVAVGYIIYGGILYSMSQGEPERLGAAKKTLTNGIIGLLVAVFAVAIVNLASNVLVG